MMLWAFSVSSFLASRYLRKRMSGSFGAQALHLLFLAVLLRVVGGGVHGHAIRDGLDQGRAAAGAGLLDGLADGDVDAEDVVAVDLDAVEAVGDGLLRDGLARRSGCCAGMEMAQWLFCTTVTSGRL
jgi:hypothetical protein